MGGARSWSYVYRYPTGAAPVLPRCSKWRKKIVTPNRVSHVTSGAKKRAESSSPKHYFRTEEIERNRIFPRYKVFFYMKTWLIFG